jgi:hypothetical protein
VREIPLLPWVIDLVERLPRQLHSDGKEFVIPDTGEKADDRHVVAEAGSCAAPARRRFKRHLVQVSEKLWD